MKNKKDTIFRRFAIVIFSLISVLGTLFIIITYLSTTYYHQASTQLLNKDVATHIAKFTSPFTNSGIDKQKADSVFQNAMVLSPSSEVYFLDTGGNVIDYHASEQDIKEWHIPVQPIQKYIATGGNEYIKGVDPKDPAYSKIFSAAEVQGSKSKLGYIYVILDSKKSEGIMDVLFGGHALTLAIQAFVVIILLSFLFSFLYLKRIRKNFNRMIGVLERFENGDYEARFTLKQSDELEPVTHAFNKMADLLSATISKLTRSEQERKNFIAIISHDLRTPLSIARGYAETLLLKKGEMDISEEEQEQHSHLIYNKMLQIENMVRQLFELSKIDAVEFKPRLEPFVLSEIVQETINTFQMVASEKKVSLKCVQCLYHVWVNADISMMERVVQNLADNALKNTPEGGLVQVAITVEGEQLRFAIENEGPPLSDELLNWTNHYNDEDFITIKRPQKAGLGLLIVQKILHLHYTSLKVQAFDGKNIFTFNLPVYIS